MKYFSSPWLVIDSLKLQQNSNVDFDFVLKFCLVLQKDQKILKFGFRSGKNQAGQLPPHGTIFNVNLNAVALPSIKIGRMLLSLSIMHRTAVALRIPSQTVVVKVVPSLTFCSLI